MNKEELPLLEEASSYTLTEQQRMDQLLNFDLGFVVPAIG